MGLRHQPLVLVATIVVLVGFLRWRRAALK